MKRVFICSPLRGDIKDNIDKASYYCKMACLLGDAPFAPHTFYTNFLDDNIEDQRDMGISAGLAYLSVCEELWAFGKLTQGMRMEVAVARALNIPVLHMYTEDLRHFPESSSVEHYYNCVNYARSKL